MASFAARCVRLDVGAYYQWENNWEVTGRAGVQSFGGALIDLTPFQPYTQPIVRFDLDRMDDNDNRLFGVTAEIAWTPKPAYQLTVRTPLYAVRHWSVFERKPAPDLIRGGNRFA